MSSVRGWTRSSTRRRMAVKGNVLAQASAASPVTQAVILFGSYVGDDETVNNVDVAVQLRRRSDNARLFLRQCCERVLHALGQGRIVAMATA